MSVAEIHAHTALSSHGEYHCKHTCGSGLQAEMHHKPSNDADLT